MHEQCLACLGNPGLDMNLVSALRSYWRAIEDPAKTDRSHLEPMGVRPMKTANVRERRGD